jgi:hypothetical protein
MSKEELEREHSTKMNKAAVERIKQEALSKTDADRIEAIMFEDDEEVTLRDGKRYKVLPASLRDARRLMKLLKTVNVDAIILNFIATEDEEADKSREEELFSLIKLAFKAYPNITQDYLEDYVDIELARKIIDILIGLNGLKKLQ